MSSYTTTLSPRATPRAAFSPSNVKTSINPFFLSLKQAEPCKKPGKSSQLCRASSGGSESYLDMWRGAVERQRKLIEFQRIVENDNGDDDESGEEEEDLEKKSEDFNKILEVSREERDRVQRMQVIDRAAAAIAAARAILNESNSNGNSHSNGGDESNSDSNGGDESVKEEDGVDVDGHAGVKGSKQEGEVVFL